MVDDGSPADDQSTPTSRRRFLTLAGVGVATGVAGCSSSSDQPTTTGDVTGFTTDAATETATETEATSEAEVTTEAETTQGNSEPLEITVSGDGSGDYETVQAAIDAIPVDADRETVVHIAAGTYREKLELPEGKTDVTFLGDGPEQTILTYDDHADKVGADGEEIGTTGSSSCFVHGDAFTARDVTFRNDAEPVAQAVAINVYSDRAVFENCRFVGNQDTLYTHGHDARQYYHDCYVEGDVDFIFGWSTAWFENCDIYCKDDGYVTAAATPEESKHGYVFNNCRVTGSDSAGEVYLGRPWRPHARTLFKNSYLGDVVHPEGWHEWDGREKTCWYAEHGNEGPGKWTTDRVSWAHQLSDYQAAYYTYDRVFTDWDPRQRLSDDASPVE